MAEEGIGYRACRVRRRVWDPVVTVGRLEVALPRQRVEAKVTKAWYGCRGALGTASTGPDR